MWLVRLLLGMTDCNSFAFLWPPPTAPVVARLPVSRSWGIGAHQVREEQN